MEKKEMDRIRTIFLVSWLAIAILGILLVKSAIENNRLKSTLTFMKHNLSTLAGDLNQTRQEMSNDQAQTANFIEWQYILKDQVATANREFQERINKIKDIRKDKSLLNLLYYNLGLNYFMAVDFKGAINAFGEAAKYDDKDAKSNYNLGLLYSTFMNNSSKAIKYYKKYLELCPQGPEAGEVRERIQSLEK